MDQRAPIAVLGAGSWGTALAMQLARAGREPVLWGRDPAAVEAMQSRRVNERYHPGIALPDSLRLEADLESAVRGADHVLLACPSHAFAELLAGIQPWLGEDTGVAWACKGFEPGSGRLLHQVAEEILGARRSIAVVTGPSFAREVALGLPTAVTAAATTAAFGRHLAELFHGAAFRAYYIDDIVGAELGGAVKNVLAVATGISDGMELGLNARAALITRGLAEMMRLGAAMGAAPHTLTGLAGMGDLVLTCTGELSRNRRLGLALGGGREAQAAMAEIGQVVEGYRAAEEVRRLAERHALEMPICEQVHGILYRGWNPQKGVRVLLSRELKREDV